MITSIIIIGSLFCVLIGILIWLDLKMTKRLLDFFSEEILPSVKSIYGTSNKPGTNSFRVMYDALNSENDVDVNIATPLELPKAKWKHFTYNDDGIIIFDYEDGSTLITDKSKVTFLIHATKSKEEDIKK